MRIHTEEQFEVELCEHLEANGWEYSPNAEGYDQERALFPADVFAWLEQTQPEELAKVVKADATPTQRAQQEQRILDRITKVRRTAPANGGGTLNVLREALAVTPAKLSMLQAQPATGLNDVLEARVAANRLRVMRQVGYSARNGNRLDLVLFMNGIPVATVELKTDLTQSAAAGLRQYAHDRPPAGEPLLEFGQGALVHFVVSNELVFMTTQLDGINTRFLPFNRGNAGGAGNPPMPGTSATAYFWQEILQRDTWIDLIARFCHYRFETKTDPLDGRSRTVASLRFPRYHQWRVVRALETAARAERSGSNYLVQHSAGSGKTDSIAWVAHRLASLHRQDATKVFDGVIVVSDRKVLDGQLQRSIEQLAAKAGVFRAITRGSEGAKSKELAAALQARVPIIGVTVQTFPYALEHLEKGPGLRQRNFAVIADEAHSSQSSGAATDMKLVLTVDAASDDAAPVSSEDILLERSARKADSTNISTFAFTATPKAKTLELFGRPDSLTGKHVAFDLYPMKQAIEEGFILDVLKNFVSYEVAFKLGQRATEDRPEQEVDVAKAGTQVLRWARLHPHNLAQKAEVIVEHFLENVQRELGGRAKAMVVTSSRKEALRYKQAIDQYIVERGLEGSLAALVAFSGALDDAESGVQKGSEASLNPGLLGRSVEEAFATDEYQVMIVAEKFQTGFDQPQLVAMYVDKQLSGIAAVQTLSRLNRVMPGKENTYVIDFVNDPGEILAAFQTYYEDLELDQPSDPDVIYDMLMKLRAQHIVDEGDVTRVVDAWLRAESHNRLVGALRTSVDRFRDRQRIAREAGDERELQTLDEFRSTASAYVRAYDFLSQMIDYGDPDVERWAIFLRVYRRAIARDSDDIDPVVTDDIVLTHYRLRKLGAQPMTLDAGEAGALTGMTAAGSAAVRDTKYGPLSAVLERINELFAASGLGDDDQVTIIERLMRGALDNEALRAEAVANTRADFEWTPTLRATVEALLYEAAAGQQAGYRHLLRESDFERLVRVMLAGGLYERLREVALAD